MDELYIVLELVHVQQQLLYGESTLDNNDLTRDLMDIPFSLGEQFILNPGFIK